MTWDADKLAALRDKYGQGHGGDLFDPNFQKVADQIFSKAGTRKAPYAGVSTLLDAPYRQLDPLDPDFGDLQVALIGRSEAHTSELKPPMRTTYAVFCMIHHKL